MQIVELEMVPLSLRPVLQRLYDMKTTQSALREGVLFSTKRNNYYYDTGTGKVIVLDDDTSYIFRVLFDPTLSAETFLISLTKVDPNAVKNLLQTIDAERLFQRPPLLSMGKEIAAGVTDTEQKVEQIILEVTEQCNFRCKYCVYSEDFSGNRDFGNRRMPTEIAFKAIDWALENSGAKLAITFYGGEPLLNFKLMKAVIERSQAKRGNKEIVYNRIRFTSEQTSIRCTNLINTFFSIVQCLISFASVVCVLVSFNGIIVIASVVASMPLFFVNKYVSSFWYKISVGRVEKQRYSDVLRDLMLRNDNIKELKLFGSLSYLKSRILNQQTDFFREDQMNRKKFCKIDTAQKAANDFVILLLKLWIIILGIKQRATLGTINLYTSSLDQIQSAIFSFCTQLNTFYEQALYLESLFDLFDMQTEDENCGTPLTEPIRTIEFRHVYFSYPATNVYALKNVSFVLDDRHTYALIGLNGSGKTTLLKLLMKLYKPTLGTILINGQDIEEIDTAGLRKRISAIFQDFIKYPFTAEENITISDLENANDLHRLSKVIDDAGAAEVIDGLPHRLQTQLQKGWNGGTELSQGQWQKIAIARCLFKQSDVYLFDEPFSALDAISEQHIIKRLNLKTKMSITIFITHRYSSLRLADFILVLKDGELVESGSHQELQKAGKYYSELIKAQIEPIDHLAQLDET